MHKRRLVLWLIVMLCATFCYASDPAYRIEGKTNFNNLGVSAYDSSRQPGYIEFRSIPNASDTRDTTNTYYLWVDNAGRLVLASHLTVAAYSSFPDGDWQSPNFASGTVVGEQGRNGN